jgi:hypothetical protein
MLNKVMAIQVFIFWSLWGMPHKCDQDDFVMRQQNTCT